jgi:hypothetical protein
VVSRGPWALAIAVLAVAGLAAQGAAQDPAPDAPAPDASPSAAEAQEAPGFAWRRVQLRGRLLVDAWTSREDGRAASDVGVDNARLELRFRPARWLRGVVEYDQAPGRHLKDAFLALRRGRVELRAGQFKPPVSPIQMESRWDVPAVDRGLLSEVLIDTFGVAGRRPGVQVTWDQRGGPWLAQGGVFRASSVRGDRIGDGAFDNLAGDWSAVKATGRVAWRKRRLQAGASLDLRPAEPVPGEGYSRYWTAGADLTLGARRRGGLRLWAEGYAGSSWQDASAFDGEPARFLAGRVLAGWRFGPRRGLYAEPYAALSLFDPDTSIRDDLLREAVTGLHVGSRGSLRLTLEARHRTVSGNAPLSLGLAPLGRHPPASATRLVAQLGAAF